MINVASAKSFITRRLNLALITVLMGLLAASASTSTPTDGETPLGLQPGAPAGAYALSDLDHINLYNGNLNFTLPLMHIGGRGGAQMTMNLTPLELKWRVLQSYFDIPPNPPYYSYILLPPGVWNPIQPGYGPGVLLGRRAATDGDCGINFTPEIRYTLTRLTFIAPDGTEYELRDQSTQGKPADLGTAVCFGGGSNFGRGKVFVTADGAAMTFVSDTAIEDHITYSEIYYPTGYLFLRDGTRFRVEGGLIKSLTDRNGNVLNFTYDQYNRVSVITDSINRTVNVAYGDLANGGFNSITWRGSGGTLRTLKIWGGALSSNFRVGTAQGSSTYTQKTYHQLFPDIPNTGDYLFDTGVFSAVELPDGRRYRFSYNSYGELARVELPTGGAYEYDLQPTDGVLYSVNTGYNVYRRVIERRSYADGLTLENKTTYAKDASSGNTSVDVNQWDGSGNLLAHSKHYFSDSAEHSFDLKAVCYSSYLAGREYLTETYDLAGSVVRKQEQSFGQRDDVPWWSTWTGPSGGGEPPNDTRLINQTTTLADVSPNLISRQEYTYDSFNNRKNTWEYDFGQGTWGALIRHTKTNYVTVNDVNNIDYTTYDLGTPTNSIHIRSLPKDQSVFTVNSSGVDIQPPAAQTTYEYDKYDSSTNHAALVNRSAISGHEAAFSTTRLTRGNATAINRLLDTSSNWVTINQQYDIAGNIVVKVDARGKATSIAFADCFGAPNGDARVNTSPFELSSVAQSSFAYPTSVTNPLQHTTYTQYDYYIGRAVDGEDERGVIDSGFYDDILDRATQLVEAVNTTDKRQTTYSYSDPSRIVTTTTDLNAYGDNLLKADAVYDGLGRVTLNRHYETPSTYIATQQTYDGAGRVRSVSNPYRVGDTVLYTTTDYDLLGRKIKVTTPDTAHSDVAYSGNTATLTDQAGKQRKTTKDGLGRLTVAVEDPGSSPHANYQTSYTYNVLDKLTHVTQGSQGRDYSFDTLGRLKQATIPEQVGSTTYTYNGNSNLETKTDPRGVVTTYVYDDINRITSVSYNTNNAPGVSATPTVTYTYDSASVPYSKGELTGVSVTSSGFNSSYSYDEYDSRARVKRSTQTTDGHTYAMKYGYDLAGHLTSEGYPSGRVVVTSYDGAGRVSDVSGAAVHYASTFTYTPHGEVKDMLLGNTLWEHTVSNSRLQLTEIDLGTVQAGTDRLKLNFDYGTTANNGNLLSQTNTVPGSPSLSIVQTYGYNDNLNRLTSVAETANQTARWTASYVYDRYGNRTTLTNTGSEASLLPTQSTPAVTAATNRFSGFTYDYAGNVKIDGGGNSFNYDAENRQTSAGASGYSYDGDGLRVRTIVNGVTTIFVYDALQQMLAEYTSANPPPPGGGGTSYLTSDHLGSTRLMTDASGNVKSRHDYMPFGEELGSGIGSRTTTQKYGAVDNLRQKFTGKQRDAESNLDYFGARYYSSTNARFTGVDPLMESAHLSMPQTWNRFAYVLDNPLVIIDPNGEGWVELNGNLGWDDRVYDPATALKFHGPNARFLPEGTIRIITGASQDSPYRALIGYQVNLGPAGIMYPIALAPQQEVKQIEWYGGNGERFLAAYFRFAVENALFSLGGEILGQALERLYQAAKATRASEATLKVIQDACFVEGTKVATPTGYQTIEELKEGDEVLSSDPECGETAWQRVTRLYVRTTTEVLDVTIDTEKITCTPEHPFWVNGAGWVAAKNLKAGGTLLTKGGKDVRLETIRHRTGNFTVYNIEVERLHSYFVSPIGILVHNHCAAPRPLPFKDAGLRSSVNRVLDNIARGVKQYARDGIEFMNKEGLLPVKPSGYYQEYTVPTPGVVGRGQQRIVVGSGGEAFYTLDHYRSFVRIK